MGRTTKAARALRESKPTGEYSLGDVCALTRATRSQVAHWCRNGIVSPDYDVDGPGLHRIFNFIILVEFAVLVRLIPLRLPLHVLGRASDALRHDPADSQVYSR